MAWTAYRNLRQQVKREVKIAEREFFTEQIQGNLGNTNNIWKAIHHIIRKRSIFQQITKLLWKSPIHSSIQSSHWLMTACSVSTKSAAQSMFLTKALY